MDWGPCPASPCAHHSTQAPAHARPHGCLPTALRWSLYASSLSQRLAACECSQFISGKKERPKINSPHECDRGANRAVAQPDHRGRWRKPGLHAWMVEAEKPGEGGPGEGLSSPALVLPLGDTVRELLGMFMPGRRTVDGESPACSPQSHGEATGEAEPGWVPSPSCSSGKGAIYLPSKQRPLWPKPRLWRVIRGVSQD